MNYIESFRKADINISTAGDNTVIAAPGDGKYIAIDFIQALPAGGMTVQLKDGTTNYGGAMALIQSQGFFFANSMHNEHGVITLGNNKAFVINLSGQDTPGVTALTGGFIRYRIINE